MLVFTSFWWKSQKRQNVIFGTLLFSKWNIIVFGYDFSDNSPVIRGFKKKEIIYRYFIVLIDSLRYKKIKFKSVTTLRGALGNN